MKRRFVEYNTGFPRLDNLLSAVAYGVTIWGAMTIAALIAVGCCQLMN